MTPRESLLLYFFTLIGGPGAMDAGSTVLAGPTAAGARNAHPFFFSFSPRRACAFYIRVFTMS